LNELTLKIIFIDLLLILSNINAFSAGLYFVNAPRHRCKLIPQWPYPSDGTCTGQSSFLHHPTTRTSPHHSCITRSLSLRHSREGGNPCRL